MEAVPCCCCCYEEGEREKIKRPWELLPLLPATQCEDLDSRREREREREREKGEPIM